MGVRVCVRVGRLGTLGLCVRAYVCVLEVRHTLFVCVRVCVRVGG